MNFKYKIGDRICIIFVSDSEAQYTYGITKALVETIGYGVIIPAYDNTPTRIRLLEDISFTYLRTKITYKKNEELPFQSLYIKKTSPIKIYRLLTIERLYEE